MCENSEKTRVPLLVALKRAKTNSEGNILVGKRKKKKQRKVFPSGRVAKDMEERASENEIPYRVKKVLKKTRASSLLGLARPFARVSSLS